MQKRPDELTSWEYLKIHLYDKPHLYETSFQKIRPFVKGLKKFRTLAKWLKGGKPGWTKVKKLDRLHPELRPEIVEILMFALWEDLTEVYGMGDGFADSYWELIMELERAKSTGLECAPTLRSERPVS